MGVFSPRAGKTSFPPVPVDWPDPVLGDKDSIDAERRTQVKERQRKVAQVVNGILDGRVNCTGNFSLQTSSLITVIKDRRCGIGSVIVLMPNTESSGGELGIYVSDIGIEIAGVPTFTVNHAFDTRADRNFRYIIMGTSTIEDSSGGTEPATDPFWDNVVFLGGFNGPDGSTNFVDESPSMHTSITAGGSAQIDTAQSKFGGSSLLTQGTGDGIIVPDSTDWHFAGDPFTIDLWVRFASLPGSGDSAVFASQWPAVPQQGWSFLLNVGASKRLNFIFSSDGTNDFMPVSPIWNPSLDTWYFVSVDRDATDNFRVYVDGVLLETGSSPQSLHNSTTDLWISDQESTGSEHSIDGWVDEFRITKGIARYGATFTPPTEAFPRTD